MTPECILVSMYPGDERSGLPSYISLNLSCDNLFEESLLAQLNDLIKKCLGDFVSQDVNDVLKAIRRENPEVMNRFIVRSLEVYFSAPQVVSVLRNGATTLFPNQRILPDIDFDLLIPVVEVGVKEDVYE